MRTKFVHYGLQRGYIDHWLVAGPQVVAVSEEYAGRNSKQEIIQRYDDPPAGITELPVERGPADAGMFKIGEDTLSWDYFACGEDHRIEQSENYPFCAFLRSWAYCQLYSRVDREVSLEITAAGPFRVWLNDELVFHQGEFAANGETTKHSFTLALRGGMNPLLIRFENVAAGPCRHFLVVRLCDPKSGLALKNIQVRIPTLIQAIGRRNQLEKVFGTLYLERDVFSWEQPILLHWPADQEEKTALSAIRLIHQSGRIYAEAEVDGTPGDKLHLGIAAQHPEGLYAVVLTPKFWEYYDKGLRMTRRIPLWNVGRMKFSEAPYGDFSSRRQEALQYAARQEGESVFREMARMALSRWDQVDRKTLLAAVERVQQRQADSVLDLLGLLGMVMRFGGQEGFPVEVSEALRDAARDYRYEETDQGWDVMDFRGESHHLLFAACEILAGQCYPEDAFSRSRLTGQELRRRGEECTLAWLHQRAAWGFEEWGSDQPLAETLAALAHLVDLAENETIWELAGALMDKLFFTLVLNSFKGVYGGASHLADAWAIKGGMVSALSGIARLMWGQGLFSSSLSGLVSLACNENYELPSILAAIATTPAEEMWGRERHTSGPDSQGANLAIYKTPDFLLASAQGYHPGRAGLGEHIWQATLGPEAVVFVNHPGCSSEKPACRPGYWRGNGVLPWVAQWKDALVSFYRIPDAAPLSYTHAYFPTFAFDEYLLRGKWAFARKGDAFLALAAANGIELTRHGPYALRELRSPGHQNAWYCQMGRAARDGDFAAFQEKVLALPIELTDSSLHAPTITGDQLAFGWEQPFLVNGEAQPLSGFPHYENLYAHVAFPGTKMDIQLGEDLLRLDLA